MTFHQGRNQNLHHDDIITLLEIFYEKYGPLSTIKYGTVFKKITIHQQNLCSYTLVILIISFVMFRYLYVLCIINRRNFQEYIIVLRIYYSF